MLEVENTVRDTDDNPTWGNDAPRGGKTVMNRILKENATVPLFFAQTLVQSMRDVGYNHTTSALCEHVDNAIQAEATEIRVYFREKGKREKKTIDVAVYDNGLGMSPNVLKVAMSFGGSMYYGNRQGIARFGMGMKTAALSISPVLEVYSWQEPEAIYTLTLDVEDIGKDRSNLVQLPDPTLLTELSDEVSDLFCRPLSYPTNRSEQQLLTGNDEWVLGKLGASGTIIYMPNCDRLHYAKAKTLVDHAVKEMARIYRREIAKGLQLYVNNRLLEAFDPTYSMPNARHIRFLDNSAKYSRLILSQSVEIPVSEGSARTAPIIIKIYKLPIEEWSDLPGKTQKHDLHIFDGLTISILRNDREVFAGRMPALTTGHSVTAWYRVQIDVPGILDEAFGVSANKQGVRPKGYVMAAIKGAIGDDISSLNEEIKRFQGERATTRANGKPSSSEAKAGEAEPFQHYEMPPASPEEEAQLEANLRGLALSLKKDGESEEEAFERVKSSRYITDFRHDEYWPFYDVRHRFGRIILTINTAHPFFSDLYHPVSKMGLSIGSGDEEASAVSPETLEGPIRALDLLLLSLARTQSRLASTGDEAKKLLDSMRREWSETYRVQMTA